jgi:hypothetical protein
MTFVLATLLLAPVFAVLFVVIDGYLHRNDPLTWDEAYRVLEANDCCTCTMCVGAHMRWGKR